MVEHEHRRGELGLLLLLLLLLFVFVFELEAHRRDLERSVRFVEPLQSRRRRELPRMLLRRSRSLAQRVENEASPRRSMSASASLLLL